MTRPKKQEEQWTPSGTVAEVMTRDVYAVAPDTSLETASRLLTSQHITGVPVVSADGRAIGVVTLSDLADPDRQRSNRDGYSLYYKLQFGEQLEAGERLEVGSGRGGGASYMARYLKPASLVGLDITSSAIRFCNRHYDVENLSFVRGSALAHNRCP